jgi:hypothetical protein
MIGYQENERLMRPLYGFAESDRLAGVTRGTSRRWLKGYRYWYADESRMALPITPERDQPDGVSAPRGSSPPPPPLVALR